HTSGNNEDFRASHFLKRSDNGWNKRFVTARQRRNPEYMHVVFDGLFGSFLRSLKQRADIHIKTDVGKRRGDNFCTPVVAVLTYFCNHYSRLSAGQTRKLFAESFGFLKFFVVFHFVRIYT